MEGMSVDLLDRLLQIGMSQAKPFDHGGFNYCLVPSPNGGGHVQLLDELTDKLRDNPRFKTGCFKAQSAVSFIEYANCHKGSNTLFFGDTATRKVTAIFDHHEHGSDGKAAWGKHGATFALRDTLEWSRWKVFDGKAMGHQAFAEFIEDNSPDIFNPPAADMIEMARNFTAKSKVEFHSAARLDNGRTNISFNEVTEASTVGPKGNVAVPDSFTLRIVPFVDTAAVEVVARIRHRITDQKLTLWYSLLRPQVVDEQAFSAAISRIEDGVGAPVLLGEWAPRVMEGSK